MPPPIRLPSDRPSALAQSWAKLRQVRGFHDLRKWSLRSFRLAELPLRIRPAFIVLTFLTLLVLSLLGFHPTLAQRLAPPDVPFSDKVLHFVCFALATALFYACWVVEEQARRVWVWRYFKEIISVVVCILVGGIGSELVQSLLPYKTFQPGDLLANVLGASLALALSHHFAREARRERELRRLYDQLGGLSDDEEEEDEEEAEADELLGGADTPAREMEEGRRVGSGGAGQGMAALGGGGGGGGARSSSRREARDPWSATEDEIFGLGDDDDEDGEDGTTVRAQQLQRKGGGGERGPL
ncbi:hypothetical protein Rhopal_007177-T1 [Rhodotorula paludigena]|uniref:VanZ-like domain-containing protein n=1 Tax=Rhodotorula paludigena TaxID=86838 RepID=A0AAV5H030_9BASI|nr:hypothetical protein Rhopal_007177-T1 [Rhodotorula paludigena]